jgi:acetyl-CoA decarbonylase/synthase complex subunit delta
MLSFPMLSTPGFETFRVKESRAPEADFPEWGDLAERGIYWEAATAMSLLMAGAELLIMYHPTAVAIVKTKIAEIFDSQKGE